MQRTKLRPGRGSDKVDHTANDCRVGLRCGSSVSNTACYPTQTDTLTQSADDITVQWKEKTK